MHPSTALYIKATADTGRDLRQFVELDKTTLTSKNLTRQKDRYRVKIRNRKETFAICVLLSQKNKSRLKQVAVSDAELVVDEKYKCIGCVTLYHKCEFDAIH